MKKVSDSKCTNCGSDERLYIGNGEFWCSECNEITDWNRVRIDTTNEDEE